jgi:hypothetical protein
MTAATMTPTSVPCPPDDESGPVANGVVDRPRPSARSGVADRVGVGLFARGDVGRWCARCEDPAASDEVGAGGDVDRRFGVTGKVERCALVALAVGDGVAVGLQIAA